MSGIGEEILTLSEGLPEGSVLTARGLLQLGTRAAIDQALSRLARAGTLLRVGRGRYVRPVGTRFGARAPAPARVIEGIAALTGETVLPSGATSANALGLTTQVPVRHVFLTSGRSRRLNLGRETVELRHAPAWQLMAPDRKAGQALRALAWMGPAHVREATRKLKASLPMAEREALVQARGALPTWLAEAVSETFLPSPPPRRRKHG